MEIKNIGFDSPELERELLIFAANCASCEEDLIMKVKTREEVVERIKKSFKNLALVIQETEESGRKTRAYLIERAIELTRIGQMEFDVALKAVEEYYLSGRIL
ncbi:MAG: hypothetical protein MJZ12_00035 [Prevotella sp.]|nr:hypothetical protein [Prevotella sp.]